MTTNSGFGIGMAAKSLLREIHATGALAAHGADTCFGPRGYANDTEEGGYGPRLAAAAVHHLDDGGFEVVLTPSMVRVAGPYSDIRTAAEEAAVKNLELRAERIDAAAIKRMAENADWWREHEDDE